MIFDWLFNNQGFPGRVGFLFKYKFDINMMYLLFTRVYSPSGSASAWWHHWALTQATGPEIQLRQDDLPQVSPVLSMKIWLSSGLLLFLLIYILNILKKVLVEDLINYIWRSLYIFELRNNQVDRITLVWLHSAVVSPEMAVRVRVFSGSFSFLNPECF